MISNLINIHHKQPYDIFIGRLPSGMHWGNVASHLKKSLAPIVVETREESLKVFIRWLAGKQYQDIEQLRRQWILDNMKLLKDKRLGCFCAPKACHGEVYIKCLK